MQELDILASTRIAFSLKVHELDLDLAEALLKSRLLLGQVGAELAFGHELLLHLVRERFRAPHLLHRRGRDVFFLRDGGPELEDFPVRVRGVAQRGALTLREVFEAGLCLLQSGLEAALLPDERVALSGGIVDRRAESPHL